MENGEWLILDYGNSISQWNTPGKNSEFRIYNSELRIKNSPLNRASLWFRAGSG
jgi:hypothetical protein